jgi:hypothetical protein
MPDIAAKKADIRRQQDQWIRRQALLASQRKGITDLGDKFRGLR